MALCDIITADKQQMGQNKTILKDKVLLNINQNVSSFTVTTLGKFSLPSNRRKIISLPTWPDVIFSLFSFKILIN